MWALWQGCRHAWIRQRELPKGLHHLKWILGIDTGLLSKAWAGEWLGTDKSYYLNCFHDVVANCLVLSGCRAVLQLCATRCSFCSTIPWQHLSWGVEWGRGLWCCVQRGTPESQARIWSLVRWWSSTVLLNLHGTFPGSPLSACHNFCGFHRFILYFVLLDTWLRSDSFMNFSMRCCVLYSALYWLLASWVLQGGAFFFLQQILDQTIQRLLCKLSSFRVLCFV